MAEFVGTINRLPSQVADEHTVNVLDTVVPVRPDAGHRDDHGVAGAGEVDVLVRLEELVIEAVPGGNGIVTDRAFLGSRLSGDAATTTT